TARCWGDTSQGELGNGSTAPFNLAQPPVTVSGLSSAVGIAAGGEHTCAMLKDGTARCWGDDSNGDLGDGKATAEATPVVPSGLAGVVTLGLGNVHSCEI